MGQGKRVAKAYECSFKKIREIERTTMKPKPHKHECGLMHLRAKSMRRRLLALAVGDDEIGVGF